MVPAFASLTVFIALWSTVPGPRADDVEFVWKYETGRTLEWTLELASTHSMETEITIDGNPAEFGGPSGHERERTRTVRTRDTLLAVKDGLPTRVRRIYEDVELGMTMGEHEPDPLSSPVVGHAIVIDASGDEITLELPEDLELTAAQRQAIAIEPKLGAFLPRGKVAVGARWEFDRKVFHTLVNHGLELHDFPEEQTIDLPDGRTMRVPDPRRASKAKEERWEGWCTLERVETRDGRRLAIVSIEATLEREAAPSEGIRVEGGALMIHAGEGEGEETLEGTLVFDLAAGRLVSLDLEGEIDLVSETESETEMGVFAMVSTTSGERRISLEVRDVTGEDR